MSITKFQDPPADTITDIMIHDDIVYISSWDCSVYAYDLYTQNQLFRKEVDFPVFKIAWKNGLIFGDSNGFLHLDNHKKINFNIKGIRIIEVCEDFMLIGGFDKKLIKFFNNGHTEFVDIEEKIYGSNIENNYLLLNLGIKIGVYDLRNFNLIKYIKNKRPIRSLNLKNSKIYLGDIDGKLKIYDLTNNEELILNAHVEMKENFKRVYPINDIIQDENYFYTCGSDGIVNRWKEENKFKSKCIFKSNLGILKMAIKENKMIVGSGYNYELGAANTSENDIYLINL